MRFFRLNLKKLAVSSPGYLKYAFGEILLVVIGILIALSINNWNEQRKDNTKEKHYLCDIQRDLKSQLSDIQKNMEGESSITASLDLALEQFKTDREFELTRELIIHIAPVNDRYTFSKVSTTFDEIQSAGHLGLIRNRTLKDAIVGYYAFLKRTEDVISNNARQANNTISLRTLDLTEISGPEVNFEKSTLVGSFDNYQTPDYLLGLINENLKQPENRLALLNSIRMKKNIANWHVKKYQDLMAQTNALLQLIEDSE